MKIKEVVVVEGKSDTLAINKAVDADTIETNGSAVNQRTLEAIRHAQAVRGVIVFTDPDVPGEKIRKKVSQYVPNCRHAFLKKKDAFGGKHRSLGIEHATSEAILEALEQVYTVAEEQKEQISSAELWEKGLIGGPRARAKREALCEKLNIGYTNGKQLYKRLLMFQISPETFERAFSDVIQEEHHD